MNPGGTQLSSPPLGPYIVEMHADAELKRLHWRAHHRGTHEADILVGGFFDAHHQSWDSSDRALFQAMLEEQDVDILAWADVEGRAHQHSRIMLG